MNIQIGKVIRTLRFKNDVTQEDLANHLGVSMQAVSRWENGACYPDLELIPVIAAYFDVTTDQLLCVEVFATKEKEEEIISQWTQAFKNAEHEKALNIINDALKSMPTNYRLMISKVTSLIVLAGILEEKNHKKEMQRMLSKAEDLCRLIISKCSDNNIRYEAMTWMMVLYNHAENTEEIRKLANEFPDVSRSKNSVLYRFCNFDKEDYKKHCRNYLYELFFEFIYCSYSLAKSTAVSNDERSELLERIVELLQTVVGDELGEFEYIMDDIYQALYELTAKKEYGDEVGQHLKSYKDLPDEYIYRSAFFYGVIFDHKNAIHAVDGSL